VDGEAQQRYRVCLPFMSLSSCHLPALDFGHKYCTLALSNCMAIDTASHFIILRLFKIDRDS